MEDNQGWIRINRKIREHWLWASSRRLQWWLDLLMMAAWEDTKTLVYNQLVTIKRGQILASTSYLRDRWEYEGEDELKHKPSPNTINNFLNLLAKDDMLTIDTKNTPNHIKLITILNYDKYQDVSNDTNKAPNKTPNKTPCKTPCKQYNNITSKQYSSTTTNNTREKNLEYLKEFFDQSNNANLEQLLMGLHWENPETKTIDDFKRLAWAAVCEWDQNKQPAKENYTEFSKYLINHVRVINKTQRQYGTTATNRATDEEAKRKRDEEFFAYIANKLGSDAV